MITHLHVRVIPNYLDCDTGKDIWMICQNYLKLICWYDNPWKMFCQHGEMIVNLTGAACHVYLYIIHVHIGTCTYNSKEEN